MFSNQHKQNTCLMDVLKPTVPTANVSVSTFRANYFNPAKQDSINKFFSQHLIRWVSIKPTICTFAYHLHESLQDRLDLHVLEPDITFSFASKKLVPLATAVRSTLSDLVACVKLQQSRDIVQLQNKMVHKNLDNLMISTPT